MPASLSLPRGSSMGASTFKFKRRPVRIFVPMWHGGLAIAFVGTVAGALLLLPLWTSQLFCGQGNSGLAEPARTALRAQRMTAVQRLVEENMKRDEAEAEAKRKKMEEMALKDALLDIELPPSPVVYSWPNLFDRLSGPTPKPGHLVQRRWLQKGKDQGYVSVPFSSAVRTVLREPDVNICLIGRRTESDGVSKAWQQVIADLPLFDISGEAEVWDLDPMEPAWETPLDKELPSDDEMRELMSEPLVLENMQQRFLEGRQDLSNFSHWEGGPQARILREVVAGLPEEVKGEENRELVRKTVYEILKMLNCMRSSLNAKRLRWRFASTDGNPDEDLDSGSVGLRAYFVLAGEGLDFVPSKFVSQDRAKATSMLDSEQIARMSSEDWAKSVALTTANPQEVLKRVPAGWTTFVKGRKWPGLQGDGATFRLRETGKRVFIQADFLEGNKRSARKEASPAKGKEEPDEAEEVPRSLLWLGPLAGLVAGLSRIARKSPPYVQGQRIRRDIDAVLGALQRTPMQRSSGESASVREFEERLWMDFADADEAPVVLVVGGQSETGKVISRKLVTSGFHVVLLKPGTGEGVRVEKLLPQGAVLASVQVEKFDEDTERVSCANIPRDLYSAVTGIDKLVVCDCDDESTSAARVNAYLVKDVLACWQMYRYDFADRQRPYSSKVRLFDFDRETDFELWETERERPSDLSYGSQKSGWTRNDKGKAMFIGRFFESVGQAQLRSPKLRLNFKRFSGLLMKAYNQAVFNKYSMFLRMSDFEETRLHYEFDFECEASTFHLVRMPFNAFKPVRADGVPLPEDEVDQYPLRREDVVQIGIAVRTEGQPRPYKGAFNYFSLAISSIRVYRRQPEPQVIVLGKQPEALPGEEGEEEEELELTDVGIDESFMYQQMAEEEAAAEIDELVGTESAEALAVQPAAEAGFDESADQELELDDDVEPKSVAQAVVESGLAYTIVQVNGLNDHPGGRFPVSVYEAPTTKGPLSTNCRETGSISRGDAAELVVSALSEPQCVNAEMVAGETVRREKEKDVETSGQRKPTFEIGSTVQENVKAYMKQITPNV